MLSSEYSCLQVYCTAGQTLEINSAIQTLESNPAIQTLETNPANHISETQPLTPLVNAGGTMHSCYGQSGGGGGGGTTYSMTVVSCPAPPTQKGRKGLVKRVALPCPSGMQ